jgi:hypothetical protein
MIPIVTGVLPNPHPDASGPCGGGPCGTIALPASDAGDASDDAVAVSDAEIVQDDVAHCGGVCGVIIHVDP